ncbi:hypothetical protein ID850_05490 [Xenorhabdus sp. Flor]|uniref:hypothetical protein n=1 Tax=Xenorhabdus cabanillasii TaxID=351673 RepID=UPI0019C5A7C9|nr:hypothetical protein [Xenorhabdus sp. Flor]MBD2814230.1 hypothetical protein [Xenorhabdus sp. Flor]
MTVTIWNWQNEEGTSELECPCGSWTAHWKRFSKEDWPQQCAVYECNGSPEVGAHIINDDGDRLIVPMCNSCNGKGAGDFRFSLKDMRNPVSSEASDLCGKD